MWMMEWLIQFGPISLFFLVFELTGKNFFQATAALIVATFLAVFTDYLRSRRIAFFPLFSAGFIFLFGGATLYFRDPQFLMVKDTLYDLIFGIGLVASLAWGKNLLRSFFDPLIAMSDRGWYILAWRWALFFLVAAVLNEVVRRFYSDEVWVHYKMINTAVFIFFGFYQFTLTSRERLIEHSNGFGIRIKKPIVPSP
jgi:intracellular septation protein